MNAPATKLCALLFAGAAALGCGGGEEETTPAPVALPVYDGTLAVEIRGAAKTTLRLREGGALDVSIELTDVDTWGVFDASAKLSGSGRVEPLPEAGSELYTAKLSVDASASGPCGDEPVSLALALHRKDGAARVGGALTAYCGKDKHYGVPARMLRLTGELPRR